MYTVKSLYFSNRLWVGKLIAIIGKGIKQNVILCNIANQAYNKNGYLSAMYFATYHIARNHAFPALF